MFNFLNRNKIVEKSLNCVNIVENFKHVEPLMEYFKKETGIDFENKKEIIRTKTSRGIGCGGLGAIEHRGQHNRRSV